MGPPGFGIFLLSLAACSSEAPRPDAGPSGPEAFSQRDSLGVVISTTSGEAAWTPLEWEVDSVPDLVIGSGESVQGTLYQVQGVKGLPAGGVVVVDGGSRELRFFDHQGRSLYHEGGKGEGPGEFELPLFVPLAGSDSLLLWDRRLRRYQVFSEDGQANRTIPLPNRRALAGLWPMGAVGPQLLLRRWDPTGPGQPGTMGRLEEGWELLWFDPSTGRRIPVARFSFYLAHRFAGGLSSIPFAVTPSVAVNKDGAFLTEGSTPEVRGVDVEGRLRQIFRIEGPLRPVTVEVIEQSIQEAAERNPATTLGSWREAYARMEIPDSLPVFEALQVDDLGWLWAKVYQPDQTRHSEWMVLDPDGRAHGVLQTPVGLEVHHIGRNFMLGVWQDELGVEYVHRHRYRRAAAPSTPRELN